MKEQIRSLIQKTIAELYTDYKDIVFTVNYARENIEADLASNAALVLAKKIGKEPGEVAREIASAAKSGPAMTIEAGPPGFLNFKLDISGFYGVLDLIF